MHLSQSQLPKDMETFDVVIVGGGLAGCATALSLYRNRKHTSCLVLDNANPTQFKIGESLPPESGRLLQYIHPSLPGEISKRLALGLYTTCTGNASAWSSSALEERHAILNPFGHGLHLNRADFDELLRGTVQRVASEAGTRLSLRNATCKGIFKGEDGLWSINIDVKGNSETILARWFVDATGRKASIATKIGAKVITPAPLLAIYAVFEASDSDSETSDRDKRTIIEASPSGWWYTSLISDSPSTRIVVFHTLPSHPAAKSSRRLDGFLESLHAETTHISDTISKWDYVAQPGFPRCTAAGSSHLEKVCDASEHWMAVGDAAVAFDPLSSQGMMTALEMGVYAGMKLAQQLENHITELELEEDYRGSYDQVWRDYKKHRAYYYSIVKRFEGEMFWVAQHES